MADTPIHPITIPDPIIQTPIMAAITRDTETLQYIVHAGQHVELAVGRQDALCAETGFAIFGYVIVAAGSTIFVPQNAVAGTV